MPNIGKCYAVEPGTAGGGGESVSRRSGQETAKPEDEIKAALKEAGIDFDSLSDDIKKDVLKKYDAYTSVLHLEGDVKSTRITNYVKALQAHKIEIAMGDFDSKVFTEALNEVAKDPDNPTSDELEKAKAVALEKRQACELKIEDSNIATQCKTGTDEEYFGALKGRGEGYVDMYDTDNDGKISFTEFKTFEEKNGGMTLYADETAELQKCFDKMDRNNDHFIDANEMASHLYAVSRMHDKGGGPNTVSDITFGEWHDSQKFTSNSDVSARYDVISSQLYGVLEKD